MRLKYCLHQYLLNFIFEKTKKDRQQGNLRIFVTGVCGWEVKKKKLFI